MIKIAFVIDTIESPTAGTEKQLLLLLKHLDRTKFKPYLCVLRSSQWLQDEFDLCELYDADIQSFKKLSASRNIYKLSRFFRAEGIDIVQTHFRDASIAGIVAARIASVKAIVGTRRNQGYWYTPVELRIQKLLNRWVTAFISNSQSTMQWVMVTEGVSEEKINVIYNAVDLELFEGITSNDRIAVRNELGIPCDAPVVGIVANLRPVKGLDVFLLAAAVVNEQVPETQFVIVGEGEERQRLEDQAQEIGISNRICFTGRRADIPFLLGAFDVGVLSSFSESFSNAIIEYLAAGLPVVATDVGGCREAVEGSGNGLIVQSNDHESMAKSIVHLVKNRKPKRVNDQNGWLWNTCALSRIINQTEELYSKLMEMRER